MSITYTAWEKFQRLARRTQIALLVVALLGALEALLLARLLARLLAAREENYAIAALYALTESLRMPLALLDAGQPQFGAVLELSTFFLAICIPVFGYALWALLLRPGTHAATRVGKATSNTS
jgi:hypothetical protein